MTTQSTSFGFKSVKIDEKQKLVNDVFSKVADRYDLMNDLMSGGLHRIWKNILIDWLAPSPHANKFKLLDVAGGTGDIARKFLAASGKTSQAMICDISEDMLRAGRTTTGNSSLRNRLTHICGNAEDLPFEDRSFDAYTIAFGIRNVTRIDRALAEAFRVLKPGGRFLCLEFSQVDVPILSEVYEQYSFKAIPQIGRLVTGNPEAYQYLVESIRRFPDQESFLQLIADTGFENTKFRNLSGGIAAIHSGWRI